VQRLISFGLCLSIVIPAFARAQTTPPLTPDWSENAKIDPSGRPNPYGWDEATFTQRIRAGKIIALNYPVTVTGTLVPERTTIQFLNAKPGDPLFGLIKTIFSLNSSDFPDFKGVWDWMGLHDYPDTDGVIPYPDGIKPKYPMGVSFIERNHTQGLTFSCAVCHSSELFGKAILGMTNRFPNANLTFVLGQQLFQEVSPTELVIFAGATKEEVKMYEDSRENIKMVGTKRPVALGLDTALSQVVLSLARRAQSPWAERDVSAETNPRPNLLDHKVADSKPAVWWNLKYKTRWLSDGSVLSGNPIITNIIWNELGRGGDLKLLDEWINQNPEVFENLTTAVFATEAPKWREYLGGYAISVSRAKRGEALFNQNCVHCHGHYEKAWSLSPDEFSARKRIHPELGRSDTIRVKYFAQTRSVDVDTDPGRREGATAIEEALNPLEISREHGIINQAQQGYVPPPLDGVFARYPYLHNNSIPNLCALMTRPSDRPVTYTSGKPIDPKTDYDEECVGYPLGEKTPKSWLEAKDAKEHHFDTRNEGLSNSGHYDGIFTNDDGTERYTLDQKSEIIEFLKTL